MECNSVHIIHAVHTCGGSAFRLAHRRANKTTHTKKRRLLCFVRMYCCTILARAIECGWCLLCCTTTNMLGPSKLNVFRKRTAVARSAAIFISSSALREFQLRYVRVKLSAMRRTACYAGSWRAGGFLRRTIATFIVI